MTEEMCKKQGKKLLNADLKDSVCCRCVSEEPHCMYKNEEKAIGAVWHEGLCNTFKCAKTPEGVPMIEMTKTECAACAPNEEKEFVANKCCPICRKKAPTVKTPDSPPTPKPTTPTKPGKCAEIMTDPTAVPEHRVTLHPDHKGTPEDLSTTGRGWPVLESDKPVIVLDLSTDKGKRPGVLQTLEVLGNVKEVTIKYTSVRPRQGVPEEFKEYNSGKPVDVQDKEITLTGADVHHEGITVFKVQITITKAILPHDPMNARIKVHACVEDAPEPCDETHLEEFVCLEIMHSSKELPDNRIVLHPAGKGTPSDLRPQGKGWTTVPSDSPHVTLNLASQDGKKPGLLEKIHVNGNVKTVDIKYRAIRPREERHLVSEGTDKEGFHEYNHGKPVNVENDEIEFTNEFTKKGGIIAYEVRITPVTPVVKNQPFNLKLKVYACIQVEYDAVVEPEPQHDLPHDAKKPNEPTEPEKHHEEPCVQDKITVGCIDIMEHPDELPDKHIILHPTNKGTPTDLRPQNKGWPVKPEDKPVITINLSTEDGKKPGLLNKIEVLGNVKTVEVEYRPIRPSKNRHIEPSDSLSEEGFKPLNGGQPIDVEHKKEVVFKDPVSKKPGTMAYEVRVTLLTPIKPEEPFNAKLRVNACIQNDLEFLSVQEAKELLQFAEKEVHNAEHHH